MDTLAIAAANLASPMVLAFALGLAAALAGTDLRLPDPVHSAISTYLLLAIGMKGGVALAVAGIGAVLWPALAALALGSAIPLWCFAILRRALGLGRADAAAIAAHYGSVSAVTFVAATAWLSAAGRPYEGFMPALVAIMEVPAIVIALLLARERTGQDGAGSIRGALHEILLGKSVLLLAGGVAMGWITGPAGYRAVEPLFGTLFQGFLVLFLLDMGSIAARRLRDLRRAGTGLAAFAVLAPIAHGALGAAAGTLVGLSPGGAMVLGTLAASASYIAAPAAVRVALPEANPTLYLTASLGVTFPFNLLLGLPLYDALARALAGAP
jgi:hypothetical protein